MKFIKTGADIPDELIRQVSQGEAVFLCGAGVSRGVGLPSFRELTDQVYAKLPEQFGSEAAERIAYDRAEYDRVLRSLEKRTHLPGTVSRVRTVVSEILARPGKADLSRHKSLLRLSRDRSGRVRLLTTNFDTLFERATHDDGEPIVSHAGKSIPRPGDHRDCGVLHLHGRIGDPSLRLDETDLILTSADFGDAYLRDGWASQYIEDRMRLNTLVLVGYAAEDAALRLLLETLDADRDRFRDLEDIYAIDKRSEDSFSLWNAKGIRPIEFTDYDAIYDTLAEWARFAMDEAGYTKRRVREILNE
jgi:hypothetical protein